MRVYHGTAAPHGRSIRVKGLRAGTCVTARRDLATDFYAVRTVYRGGVPEAGGLLVAADVSAADLAPAPRAAMAEERAYRLRVPIDPDDLELIPFDIDRERLAAMHARVQRRRGASMLTPFNGLATESGAFAI
jgi:hypothetical protein